LDLVGRNSIGIELTAPRCLSGYAYIVVLSIYAQVMVECRVCSRSFEGMHQLAGHYRVYAQTGVLQALVRELERQGELLERGLAELESLHRMLESLGVARTPTPSESGSRAEEPAPLARREKPAEEAGLLERAYESHGVKLCSIVEPATHVLKRMPAEKRRRLSEKILEALRRSSMEEFESAVAMYGLKGLAGV